MKFFPKKSMFIKGANNMLGLPDGICSLNPKSKKNYRNIKSTFLNQNFPKKTMFSTRKGAKNVYGSYPTEFAGSTQNPKTIGTKSTKCTLKVERNQKLV
jgi:hypothetical protein